MTTLHSVGWRVHPSFVPHGPIAPVTLLADDEGLTQLAGVYPVAWQTPWSEITDLALVRRGARMVLVATVSGRRVEWRHRGLEDFEAVRALVEERGGTVGRVTRRRWVILGVAGAVVVASLGGVIGALLHHGTGPANERSLATGAGLTARDLPAGWSATPTGLLSFLDPPAGGVDPVTTTMPLAVDLVTPRIVARFQSCLGVSASADRVFGRAAQLPDAQVTSPIYHRVVPAETELATVAQVYATTTMVRRDVAEMSRPHFGACFAAASASLLESTFTGQLTLAHGASSWTPRTFARGWARGGVVPLHLPGVTRPYELVVEVVAGGHDETTLSVVTPTWPADRSLVAGLVGTLKARIHGRDAAA